MATAGIALGSRPAARKKLSSMSRDRTWALRWSYFFLVLFAIFFLIPPIYMLITALFSTIVTFANFDIVRIITGGGPIDTTHVFATWSFWLGIQGGDIPLGASVSLFMVPILAVAAIFILRDVNKRGNEA
jgi:ABC-type sugar transport system permease subunit